ncbi:enoyl-CoA hydratase/isomerase family protein [Pontixanthobacter gangjinensis]|uniref:Enoyl-CoA hydratase/isomerase family protein n=1 Tax=Pontixanthobacter gangjinensis TaxID=1028742 RepID=A0A6I4SPB9_9SPHN|nr:enoyl-CoA hydratase-related protein [Pontixanthobacter gangjinensis]MXO57489.1 enoyl-CoA hydratase/isomerase family protein [Pontixanthobacter gangjinensis]
MKIRFERNGPVGAIVIDRAERRNAITLAMWQAIPDLLSQASSERGLKVLVVRSAEDGSFSAGADIGEMIANKDDAVWRAANQAAINVAQHRLARFTLPTIAFVGGDCIGGGCALALACDIRVATPNARFGITPAKLGLVYPFHDIKLLVDLVGPGQAKRLLFTGEFVDAMEARDIGLIEIIASSPDALERVIAQTSANSNTAMKQMVRRVLDGQHDDDAETLQMFAAAFEGSDFAEGSTAFAEKRRPQFEG